LCTPKNVSYVSATGTALAFLSGGLLTWSPSKKTTPLGKPTVKKVTPDKCAVGGTEYSYSGSVSGGTATYTKKGDVVTAKVCVTKLLAVSLLPGTKLAL